MSEESKIIYLLDTNVLIGFATWVPVRVYKKFWDELSDALQKGEWVLLDVVANEVEYPKELVSWCREQKKKGLIRVLTDAERDRGIEINNTYKMIDETTQRSTVDTYLIAHAEANKLGIFSRESPRQKDTELYKIPDVCEKLRIKRIKMPEAFLKHIGF
jgi:hypothetical protein